MLSLHPSTFREMRRKRLLRELVTVILELCKSKMTRRCSTCSVVVEATALVAARLLSETKGCFLDEGIQYRLAILDDIVKDVLEDSQHHKAALSILGLRPFKHDEAAVQQTKERLCLADSPGTIALCSVDAFVSARWTKPLRIVCQGLEAVANGIPVVAPLSIIPKAVAAAAGTVDKRHENNETHTDLRERVVEIEALGQFCTYKGIPIHDFQQVSETIDSRHSLKRLAHATSEEQLLRNVGRRVDRGLLMENVSTLNDIMPSCYPNLTFLSSDRARSGEISWMSSGVEATFTC
ncbi:hypothetical protein BDZ89DRAFT_1084256 [Hymenopellis radicata]|nr:hypothetical protein BDZ89DRAFT_1084256 [Hymenopellis radicata]